METFDNELNIFKITIDYDESLSEADKAVIQLTFRKLYGIACGIIKLKDYESVNMAVNCLNRLASDLLDRTKQLQNDYEFVPDGEIVH